MAGSILVVRTRAVAAVVAVVAGAGLLAALALSAQHSPVGPRVPGDCALTRAGQCQAWLSTDPREPIDVQRP